MLQIRSVSKHYGQAAAVDSVSLSVPEGSFLVLLGPSGCGKTTLLRMLAGLEMPSSGQIVFFNETVSDGDRARVVDPSRRNSGLVFQSYALWPHMTVRGNVEWPLKVAGFDREARTARADEVLGLLDIATLADRYPNEISGGQQQRVAIARTIATRPKVLLFDEPLSNLDAKLRVEMRTELMRLHRATGATTVYVAHDQIEAMTMATHVAVMNHGRIEQFGTPEELVKQPASEFVATFVGTPPNNVVPVAPNGSGWKLGGIATPLVPPEGAVLAMYPADALTLDEKDGICMELVEVTTMAGRAMVTGIADGLRLTAVVDRVPNARVTEKIHFHLPAEPTCWFDAQGRRIG